MINKNIESRNLGVHDKNVPGFHNIYRPTSNKLRLPAQIPKGQLCLLEPKLIESHNIPEHKRIKQPRFIPLEPYSCAISLLVKSKAKTNCIRIKKKINFPNIIPNVEQIEFLEKKVLKSEAEIIKSLKHERDFFESQFILQSQINFEIKSLLKAVIGEDLQKKLKILKNDKIQLAQELLSSIDEVSKNTDQIELLSGQCEVWRSKFLASSLIIENLVKNKNELIEQNQNLIKNNLQLIKISEKIRGILSETLRNLVSLTKEKYVKLNVQSIENTAEECLKITKKMISN